MAVGARQGRSAPTCRAGVRGRRVDLLRQSWGCCAQADLPPGTLSPDLRPFTWPIAHPGCLLRAK